MDTVRLYFTTPPNLTQLCLVTVTVPPSPGQKTSSANQPQIIKCRELIFTEPDIIATPLLNMERKLLIIMPQSLYKSGKLHNRFRIMGLEVSKPLRVVPAQYQACLSYTLLAKLAPHWNKVGEYLIQEFQLNVSENEVYIALRAATARLPPSCLEDLNISHGVLREFLSTDVPHIQEYSIANKWCHILPSMKKGQVINVCKTIPKDSSFKSYKEIKRYWKNTYGYRLPEDADGILYYQVYFKPIGNMLFTYPQFCVKSSELMFYPRPDAASILSTFLRDLHTKLPTVCGQRVAFYDNSPQFTDTSLSNITQTENGAQRTKLNLNSESTKVSYPSYAKSAQLNQPKPIHITSTKPHEQEPFAVSGFPRDRNDHISTAKVSDKESEQTKKPNKVIPVFKAKASVVKQLAPSTGSEGTSKIIPCFKPRISSVNKPPAARGGNQYARLYSQPQANQATCSQGMQETPQQRDGQPAEKMPTSTTCPKPSLPQFNINRSLPQKPTGLFSKTGHQPGMSRSQPVSSTLHGGVQAGAATPGVISRNQVHMTTQTASDTGVSTSVHSGLVKKRKQELEGENENAAKKRNKPVIENSDEVTRLAKMHQLGKVNSASLLAWLKERGIPHKSKDKKNVLIDKVNEALNLTLPEQ